MRHRINQFHSHSSDDTDSAILHGSSEKSEERREMRFLARCQASSMCSFKYFCSIMRASVRDVRWPARRSNHAGRFFILFFLPVHWRRTLRCKVGKERFIDWWEQLTYRLSHRRNLWNVKGQWLRVLQKLATEDSSESALPVVRPLEQGRMAFLWKN